MVLVKASARSDEEALERDLVAYMVNDVCDRYLLRLHCACIHLINVPGAKLSWFLVVQAGLKVISYIHLFHGLYNVYQWCSSLQQMGGGGGGRDGDR